MKIVLCTIGFAGKTAEEFFSLLQQAGVRRVIDIRVHRGGQLSGFAKHPDLAFFLDRIGAISYTYEPLVAPSVELLKSYRKSKDWQEYETEFLALMKERDVPGAVKLDPAGPPLALLCSEPGPETCHRRLVADILAEHWRADGHDVDIRHLVLGRPAAPRKRQPRRRSGQ